MRIVSFIILASFLLLSGCVSNPKGINCQKINWERLGYQDGLHGHSREDLSKRLPMCGPNIRIDHTTYRHGWSKGMIEYCQPSNGFRLGKEGKRYSPGCPVTQISAIDKAWRDGLRVYCTPENAYKLGLGGQVLVDFCAPDLNHAFQRAYQKGQTHYQQLAVIKSQLDRVSVELANVQRVRTNEQKALQSMQMASAHQSFSPQKQYRTQQVNLTVKRLLFKELKLKEQDEQLKQQYDALRNSPQS